MVAGDDGLLAFRDRCETEIYGEAKKATPPAAADSLVLSDLVPSIKVAIIGNQPAQQHYLADMGPGATAYTGGFGSGKTWAGARKFLWLHIYNHRSQGMVVAPTNEGMWRFCIPELQRACEEWGLEYSIHPHGRGKDKAKHMLIEGRPVWLFSGEEPSSITGIEVGHCWCDEYARYPADPYNPLRNAGLQIRGRLRCKYAKLLHLTCTGTPEGLDTPLERDFAAPATRKPRHRIYRGSTRHNPALPTGYLTGLLGDLSANMIEQYVDGIAVSYLASRAHQTFSVADNVREIAWDPKLKLHLGADYNVSPLCFVAAQISNEEVRVLDEVVIEDFGQVDAAVQAAHDRGWGNYYVEMHPDRSAKARSTVGDPEFTTMQNQAKALKWRYGGNAYGANPPVNGRINLLSRMCLDANGKRRLLVHPRCKVLIHNLLNTGRGANGYDPGSEGKMGHILDALGYLVWDECRPGQAITTVR